MSHRDRVSEDRSSKAGHNAVGAMVHLDDDDQPAAKNGSASLLGRKVLGRRNSLQSERSKVVFIKKLNAANESATSQNSTLSAANKRLSLHDLSKSSNSSGNNSHLIPPPRAPLGICSFSFVN